MKVRLLILAGIVALAGCGKIFPLGERLTPGTYGPPFGSALKDNQPHHPHNPASAERHSQADSAHSRTFGSHAACHTALSAAVAAHDKGRVVRISSVETLGHYEDHGEVHEQRCSDYVLSHRSWCANASRAPGGGHGKAHKRAEEAECGASSAAH